MKRHAAKPRKKCNRCYSINPPDSMKCSVCQTAFALPNVQVSESRVAPKQSTSTRKIPVNKPLALSSNNSESGADFLFTSEDVDLLFSLNNFSASKKEESTKICLHCQAENPMTAAACTNCEFTFNAMPFLVHPAENGNKGKYLLMMIGVLVLIVSVGLIWTYFFR